MTCQVEGCNETTKGWWGSLDKCSSCEEATCPAHLIVVPQHQHLFEGVLAEDIKRLCVHCVTIILKSKGLEENKIYSQTEISCAKEECKNSHAMLCGDCGHRFCKEHVISKALFQAQDWQEKIQFSTAAGICESCLSQKNLIPNDGCGVLSKEQLAIFEQFGKKIAKQAAKDGEKRFYLGALVILFVGKLCKEKKLPQKHLNNLSHLAKYSISDLELLPSHLHPSATYIDDMFFFAQYFVKNRNLVKKLEGIWAQFSPIKTSFEEACQTVESFVTEANFFFQKAAELLIAHHHKWPLHPNIFLSQDKENENKLPQLLQFNTKMEKEIVIFVHGFLGEKSDHHYWKEQISRYVQRPASHFMYRWDAGTVEELVYKAGLAGAVVGSTSFLAEKNNIAMVSMLANIGAAAGAKYYWQQCRTNADFQVLQLVALLQREVFQDCNITLIGHSLGGRIVLKAAEYCGAIVEELGMPAVQLRSVVALAPAILDEELDWSMVRKGIVKQKPEIFYSNEDLILSLLFRAGEGKFSPALGFQGSNSPEVFNIDCSRFDLGHNDYAGAWGRIFRYSNSILRC